MNFKIVALVLFLGGCSSIGEVSETKATQLQAGLSVKKDVITVLGLPNSVTKNSSDGSEDWFYTNKSISKGFFVPLPVSATSISSTTSLVSFVDVGSKNVTSKNVTALTCHFDKNGVLMDINSTGVMK